MGRRPQSAVGSVSSQHSLTLKVNTTVVTLQREVCLEARSWSKDQSCSRFHDDAVGISEAFPTERAGDRKTKNKRKRNPAATHHFPAAVPLSLLVPLSPSSAAVAPQEELGVVDGLGDHVALAQET